MASINNFIFDIDGTLIDSYDMYMPPMFTTLAKHGIHFSPAEEKKIGKLAFGITGSDALKMLKIDPKKIPVIQQEWFKQAFQRADAVKAFPGIAETLDKLAQRQGSHLAIGTSKRKPEYNQYFADRFFFAGLFDEVVTSDMINEGKPAPDMVEKAIADLGVNPDQAVYVGDTINDLKAAHAAGVPFAAALYGSVNPDSIKDQADFQLHTPADLLKIS